jgi:hypothetical protein
MASHVRRAAGAVLIVAACGTAATGFLVGARADASHPAARMTAEAARRKIDDAWRTQQRLVEASVTAAAAVQPLQAALHDQVDGHTLVDLFETEEWWRVYRDEFKAARVVVRSEVLGTHGKLELATLDRELVTAARKGGVASAMLSTKSGPVLAAAARIPVPGTALPVLLLAKPMDDAVIRALAEETGQAVMLADSTARSAIAFAGPPEARGLMQALLGREAESTIIDPRGQWVASPLALSPTLQLWTLRAGAVEGFSVRRRGLVPWAVAPVVLAIGLYLLIVGRRPSGAQSGAVSGSVVKEATLRFGTPARPQRGIESRVLNVSSPPQPPRPVQLPGPGAVPMPGDNSFIERVTGGSRPPPQIFGRYKLLEPLGKGGMSEIYTAVAYGVEGFTRTFVLKRLRPELAHDKEAVSQFIDEARMQASLVHSNIVPVFDFGVVGNEYFMTQEYILGRDMVRVAQRYHEHTQRPLEARFAYYVAHETLLALQYAHTKRDREGQPMGIVHRDVSAGNILMSSLGEVKLFDFGIVKANRRNTQTQVGMVKGNASFMSPEQARGHAVDPRSDLFSMGLVMYYCITNQLLYDGDNDLDVLYKAATGLTAADWEKVRKLPRPAAEILTRALAMSPADRFQSAGEFAQALAPHVTGVKADASNLMQLLFGEELRREAA